MGRLLLMEKFRTHQRVILLSVTALLIVLLIRQSLTSDGGITLFTSRAEILERDMQSLTIPTAFGPRTYAEINEAVFKNLGYRIKNASVPIPELEFINEPQCYQIYPDWLDIALTSPIPAAPPAVLSDEEKQEYTMFGYSVFTARYRNDRSQDHGAVWKDIDNRVADIEKMTPSYGVEGRAVWNAMKRYPLTGMKGMVIGSLSPWVEAYAFSAGASEILTLEYRNTTIIDTNKNIKYMHPLDFSKDYWKYLNKYDFAVSFSSIEHSGLQRYGDPKDPIGDIREVLKVRCNLKSGGLFFLGLPRGQDEIVYNLHRIYGRIRLAMLFAGFELQDVFRFNDLMPYQLRPYDFVRVYKAFIHDVFVLKKL